MPNKPSDETTIMSVDKDRIEVSAEQAKGKRKEIAGKTTGVLALAAEGKGRKIIGKAQNALRWRHGRGQGGRRQRLTAVPTPAILPRKARHPRRAFRPSLFRSPRLHPSLGRRRRTRLP
jgi:uncharacterized protein YjbJ (UPF0337 family)